MSMTRIFGILVVIALLGFAIHRGRDPMRTALPFGTTDLASVDAALQKLQPDDRGLVEAYVKRSNGDVLTPKFADPDEPFTARTFAEAIVLEKAWAVKRGEQEDAATSRQADRDAAMEPLRDAVDATVTRTELLSPRELTESADQDASVKGALPSDDATVFVATVSLHNTGNKTIVGVQGTLEARQGNTPFPLQLCWVHLDARQPIEADSRIKIRCGNAARRVSAEERAFIADSSSYSITWDPTSVLFADGSRLDSGN